MFIDISKIAATLISAELKKSFVLKCIITNKFKPYNASVKSGWGFTFLQEISTFLRKKGGLFVDVKSWRVLKGMDF